MNHTKVVDAIKAQREILDKAFSEISRLKAEAFDAVLAEREAIKQRIVNIEEQAKAEKERIKMLEKIRKAHKKDEQAKIAEQKQALDNSESEVWRA